MKVPSPDEKTLRKLAKAAKEEGVEEVRIRIGGRPEIRI
jgi:hypothetical protein